MAALKKGTITFDVLLVREEKRMFRVDMDSLKDYLDFDLERKSDLRKLDKLIRRSAPGLKRYFHSGTPAGEHGMRFKMIGYGKFQYVDRDGQYVDWPAVGVALQKNYISVYLSVMKDGASLIQLYSSKLGLLRLGRNNFSFRMYEDLDVRLLASLFAEVEQIFQSDPCHCNLAHGGMRAMRARGQMRRSRDPFAMILD
jgi:hypothetical protein